MPRVAPGAAARTLQAVRARRRPVARSAPLVRRLRCRRGARRGPSCGRWSDCGWRTGAGSFARRHPHTRAPRPSDGTACSDEAPEQDGSLVRGGRTSRMRPAAGSLASLSEDINLVGCSTHGVEDRNRVATLTHAVCRKGERHRQGGGQVQSERGSTAWASWNPLGGRSCSVSAARPSGSSIRTFQTIVDVVDYRAHLRPR